MKGFAMPNKPAMTWSICDLCKRPYQVAKKELRKGRRFCCKKHADIGKRRVKRDQWGEKNPNWKGGVARHSKGYVLVRCPEHPRSHNGYVLEHILIAEAKLGRQLYEGEVAHHANEIKSDNRIKNILVMKLGEHTSYHNKRRKDCI
jgi:23S rRNA C2498 (ribose-2'-O)-methylase RlmM